MLLLPLLLFVRRVMSLSVGVSIVLLLLGSVFLRIVAVPALTVLILILIFVLTLIITFMVFIFFVLFSCRKNRASIFFSSSFV